MASIWELPGIVDRLKALHADETQSYSMMAALLNNEFKCGITRAGISGKVDRLNLPPRIEHQKERNARAGRVSQAMRRVRKVNDGEAPPPLETGPLRLADVVPLMVSLFDLKQDQCRYPFGEFAPYLFCGCETVAGKSYCGPHVELTTNHSPLAGRERPLSSRLNRKRHYASFQVVERIVEGEAA